MTAVILPGHITYSSETQLGILTINHLHHHWNFTESQFLASTLRHFVFIVSLLSVVEQTMVCLPIIVLLRNYQAQQVNK